MRQIRASRTIPYISKVTGLPIVDIATRIIRAKSSPIWVTAPVYTGHLHRRKGARVLIRETY